MTGGGLEAERRGGRRALWWNLGLGAVVLVSVSFLVGMSGFFFIDEAALLGQLELRADGEWVTPRPLADIDPDGSLTPMVRSYVTEDGYGPFVKHPFHVQVAAIADGLAGRTGVRLLSSLGVLVASASAWVLARRASVTAANVAFWVVLTASPLVFDAQLVVAHAIAAGVAGLVFVALDRAHGARRLVLLGLLLVVGSLLRSEFVLLGLSIGLVYGVRGLWRRHLGELGVAGMAGVAALGAHWLEPRIVRLVAGGSAETFTISGASQGGLPDLVGASSQALFGSLTGTHGSISRTLLVSILVVGLGAVARARLRPGDPGPTLALACIALVLAFVWILRPTIASGLLVAFPLLLVLAWPRGTRTNGATVPRPLDSSVLLVVPAVFAVAVLLLQYEQVGGLEWGWRYVALVLPPVCAWLGVTLQRAWRSGGGLQQKALALLVVAFWLVPLGGLREQHRFLENTATFEDEVRLLQAEDADWIVSVDPSFGRFAYELSLEGRLVTVGAEEADDLLGRLFRRGAREVIVVWRGDAPTLERDGLRWTGSPTVLTSGYRWQRVALPE